MHVHVCACKIESLAQTWIHLKKNTDEKTGNVNVFPNDFNVFIIMIIIIITSISINHDHCHNHQFNIALRFMQQCLCTFLWQKSWLSIMALVHIISIHYKYTCLSIYTETHKYNYIGSLLKYRVWKEWTKPTRYWNYVFNIVCRNPIYLVIDN